MTEHLFEILGFAILGVFATVVRWIINLMRYWLDEENAERSARVLDSIIDKAVMAIEEESRSAMSGQKPTSSRKRELATGFVTRMLQERKITVPLDIIIGRIDAAVYRLFHHER